MQGQARGQIFNGITLFKLFRGRMLGPNYNEQETTNAQTTDTHNMHIYMFIKKCLGYRQHA